MKHARCVHVRRDERSPGDLACALGIDPRTMVGGPSFGWLARCPCRQSGLSRDLATCPSFEAVTPEQMRSEAAEMEVLGGAVMRALAGEDVVCPKCDKPVEVSRGRRGFALGCPCGHVAARGH